MEGPRTRCNRQRLDRRFPALATTSRTHRRRRECSQVHVHLLRYSASVSTLVMNFWLPVAIVDWDGSSKAAERKRSFLCATTAVGLINPVCGKEIGEGESVEATSFSGDRCGNE